MTTLFTLNLNETIGVSANKFLEDAEAQFSRFIDRSYSGTRDENGVVWLQAHDFIDLLIQDGHTLFGLRPLPFSNNILIRIPEK